MKKIFLFVFSLIAFSSVFSQTGNDTTKYTWYKYTYGNRLQRYWADSVLVPPKDTIYSKWGVAIKGNVMYFGNGTRWFAAGSGSGTDTAILTQIGTGAGQIQTLYAVDGNLRKSRWITGYGTVPRLAADSAATFDIDTTQIAALSQVITLIGSSVNNLQQVIDNGNGLTRDDTVNMNAHKLLFYSDVSSEEFQIQNKNGSNQTSLEVFPTAWSQVTTDGTTNNTINVQAGQLSLYSSQGAKLDQLLISPDSISIGATNGTTVKLSLKATTARLTGLSQANDTTTYKPIGVASDGLIKRMDGWPGSGGSGSSNSVGRDTVQAYASGATLTQSASTNYIQVNPASVQAALTITTLASGGTWHTSNDLYIVFGGTVTSGNPVITAFVLTAGAGLTIVESAAFSGQANAGDVAHYHKIGSVLYRVP